MMSLQRPCVNFWYNILMSDLSFACLFSNHKYLRKKLFAATIVLLAMSTLSFAHYFRPRHTVPGGRIPLLKTEGEFARAAAACCGRKHSSLACFSSFFNMQNLSYLFHLECHRNLRIGSDRHTFIPCRNPLWHRGDDS